MSHCDDALTSLYQYLDQELEEASAAQIRLHLDGCGDCGPRFEFETRLKTVIRERLAEDVPEEFIARLHRVLADEWARDA